MDVETGRQPFWRGFRPSRIARIWYRADLYAAIVPASQTTISATSLSHLPRARQGGTTGGPDDRHEARPRRSGQLRDGRVPLA